jgi:transcription elongation factor Elf1
MLLIFGTRAFETLMVLVFFSCPHCGVHAQQRVTQIANKFTFFFLPLFAVSRKYFVECDNCGAVTALTSQQAAHSIEWAASQR